MVSIVITTYNYGSYLSFSIESALMQTFKDIEIIVIDDGSTDNTREIIEKFLNIERLKYIYQENAGQARAKNKGISESTGDFIAFLDADDIWMPTKLEQQMQLFSDSDVGVVYSRRQWIDSVGDEIFGNERILRRGWILDHIFIDNFVCFSSSVIRRSYLEKIGLFDENFPMGIDYDLWIRLASVCKFDFVNEPLVKYRTGHLNLSKNIMKRYNCAQMIMLKNLHNPTIRNLMSWYVPSLAWSDTWSNFGLYLATIGRKKEGLFFAFRAICRFPFHLNVYKRFFKLMQI